MKQFKKTCFNHAHHKQYKASNKSMLKGDTNRGTVLGLALTYVNKD